MKKIPRASQDKGPAIADWLNVLIVTAGSFIMVTSEFLPIGLLSKIASDIHRPAGELGLMVTAPGFFAAVAAPLSLFMLRRFDRRHILIALAFLIALADFVVATAAGFGVMLLGRVMLGAAVGAFWSYSPDAARRLVTASRGNLAVAIVLGGISLGTIVGVPIGAYLGALIGWRLTFGIAVAFAGAVGALQLLALPPISQASARGRLALGALLRLRHLPAGFVAITLVVLGHFAGYTYLEVFVQRAARPTASQLSWVLAVYGLAGLAGTFDAERLTRISGRFAFPIVAAAMAASLVWCLTMPGSWILVAAPVALWGATYGGVPVCSRLWLYQAAPEHSEAVSAVYVSAFQLSLAAGAFSGGLIFDHAGIGLTLSSSAMAVAAGGLIMLLTSLNLRFRPGTANS